MFHRGALPMDNKKLDNKALRLKTGALYVPQMPAASGRRGRERFYEK